MKAFTYRLGSPEAMRQEPSFYDPREARFDFDCERCHDNGELPDGSTCPDCCPHDEKDHGICLDCHKDCFNDDVAAAEFRSDCINDR